MYEGIKVQNGGKVVDLNNLPKTEDGELVLNGIESLKVFVENGAIYNQNVEILENNSDVKISITDSEGNDIFIILKGLNDILLTNNGDVPVFEVFQGTEKLASMTTIDDLEAAAAGGDLTSDQSGNPDGAGALGGTDSGALAGRIDTLGLNEGLVPPEGNSQPVVFNVDIEVDEVQGEEGAGDKNIYNGQLEVTDPDPEDTGLHTFTFVADSLVVTSSSGVITEIEDEIEVIINPDGSFTISGDFNDLAFGEDATVSFDYTATDPGGSTSDPATVTFTVNGTNDIPVIEDITVENNQGDIIDLYDDGSYVLAWTEYSENYIPDGDGYEPFDRAYESEINIFAQKYDVDGNKVGDEIIVDTIDNNNTSFYNDSFSVIALSDGGFTVNWRTYDYDQKDDGYGLHYQRYDVDGNASHEQVVIDESQEEGYQHISKAQFDELNDGSIAIAWKENNDDGYTHLLVQRVGADGNPIGEPVVVAQEGYVDGLDNDQYKEVTDIYKFEIEPNGDSGFKVVWYQYVQEGYEGDGFESSEESYYQLMYAEFDDNGDQVGNTVEVSRNDSDFNNPEITSLVGTSEGQEAVSWMGYGDDYNDYGFYVQLVDSSSLVGEPILLLDEDNRDINGTPDVAALEGGGFVVTWKEYSYANDGQENIKGNESEYILYTQIFDASGEAVTEPIFVYNGNVDLGTAVHYDPSVFDVRGNADGGYTIAWVSDDYDGERQKSFYGDESDENSGLYYFTFDSEGNLVDSREPLDLNEAKDGTNVITGVLSVSDDDETDTHTFEQFGEITVTHDGEEQYYGDGFEYDVEDPDKILTQPEVFVTMAPNEETGEWEYTIEGDFNYLAVGETATISFQYRAIDDANTPDDPFTGDAVNESSYSDPKTITVTIIGTNDEPVLESAVDYGEDGAPIIETSMKNSDGEPVNTITGTINAIDDDIHDSHHFRLDYVDDGQEFLAQEDDYSKDYQYVQYHRYADENNYTSETRLVVESNDIDANEINIQDIRLLTNDKDDSKIDFELDGDFGALGVGEIATVTFEVKAGDGRGFSGETNSNETTRSEPHYVTITVEGTNDQPVVKNVDLTGNTQDGGLDEVIEVLNDLESMYPLRYDDLNPNYWGDAGHDMYDHGNILNINGSQQSIWETTNTSDNNPMSWGDYTFRTNPSSTVLFIDNFEGGTFEITGNLGSDSNTQRWNGELDIGIDGYRAFYNQSTDGGSYDPSVNQLIITNSVNADFTPRTYSNDYDQDGFVLENLDAGSTVQYILFAGTNGYRYDLDTFIEIARSAVSSGAVTIYETHDDDAYENDQDDTQDDVTTLFEGELRVHDDDVNDTHTFHLTQGSVTIDNMPTQTITLGSMTGENVALSDWGEKDNNHTRVMELENGMTITTVSDSAKLKQYDSNTEHKGQGIGDKDSNGIDDGETITITFDGGQVNSATFGLDGLGDHFLSDSDEQAQANWVAYNNGEIVDQGTVTIDPLSPTTFTTVNTGTPFDEVRFSTDSDVSSDWVLSYVEAEVMPLEVVVDENGDYDVEGNFNYLAAGETATVTFDYYAVDNQGITDENDPNHELSKSEPATVTLEITGTNDQPIIEDVTNVVSEESLIDVDLGDGQEFIGDGEDFRYESSVAHAVSDDDDSDEHTFAIDEGTLTLSITTSNQAFLKLLDIDMLENIESFVDDNANINQIIDFIVTNDDDNDDVADSVTLETAESFLIPQQVITMLQNYGLLRIDMDENGDYVVESPLFNLLGAHDSVTIGFDYRATDTDATFTRAAFDGQDGLNESSVSEAKTVTLTIEGTNDQPVAYSNEYESLESDLVNTDIGAVNTTFNSTLPGADTGHILGNIFTRFAHMDEDLLDLATLTFHLETDTGTYPDAVITTDVVEETQADQDDDIVVVDSAQTVVTVNEDGTFSVSNPTFDNLAVGESATVTFQYYVNDESGAISTEDTPEEEAVDNNHESFRSEPVSVTLTITGTNDQPVVENVSLGIDNPNTTKDETIYESKDAKWYQDGRDNTQGDVDTKIRNNKLFATDDDTNDEHVFDVKNYTASKYYGQGNGGPGQNGQNGDIRFDNVDFYKRGASGDDRVVKVMIASEAVNVHDLDVKELIFKNNDGADSKIKYDLEGDFNALGNGETATVTFQYFATDTRGFGANGDADNEASHSEPKLVTITITGTNDQPIVTANKVYNVLESDGDNIPTVEEETTTLRLGFEVSDDDVNDTVHKFSLESIENNNEVQNGFELFGPITYINADNIVSSIHVQIKLPSDVDADDISIDSIRIEGNEFILVGKFDALSGTLGQSIADVLEIKFKYFADDLRGFGTTGDSHNEASISETHWLSVKVEGTNDVPTISVVDAPNWMLEDNFMTAGKLTTTGILDIDDFDNSESFFDTTNEVFKSGTTFMDNATTSSSDLGGVFAIDANGNWTYEVDSSHSDIQALGKNEFIEQTYTVTSVDGTQTHDVTVKIWGENDAPEFDSNDPVSITGSEDASIAAITALGGTVVGDFDFESLVTDVDDTDAALSISDITELTGNPTTGWSGSVIFTYINKHGMLDTVTADLAIDSEGQYTISNIGDLNPIPSESTAMATLSFAVSDDSGAITPTYKIVNISISGDNDAPAFDVAAAIDLSIDEDDAIALGTPITGDLDFESLVTDVDDSDDALSISDITVNGVVATVGADTTVTFTYIDENLNPATVDATVNIGAEGAYTISNIGDLNPIPSGSTATATLTFKVQDDEGLKTDSKTINISILGEADNTPPTIDANQVFDVVEDSAVGAVVGMVVANDADVGDVPIYSLLDNTDKFAIDSSTGVITVIGELDYETTIQYTVGVRVTDSSNASVDGSVTVDILNLNEPVTGGGTITISEDNVVLDSSLTNLSGSEKYKITSLSNELSVAPTESVVLTLTYDDNAGGVSNFIINKGLASEIIVPINASNSSVDSVTGDITVTYTYTNGGTSEELIESLGLQSTNQGFTLESYDLVYTGTSVQKLTLEAVDIDGDHIDMVQLLSNVDGSVEDLDPDGRPTSLDTIDMTTGDHILSNISVLDVLTITDDDNTLKIEGDSGDEINLDMTKWQVNANDSTDGTALDDDDDGDGYVTYTNIGGSNASDTVQLLIDEDIDVKLV